MEDNIVKMPDRLERRAQKIEAAIARRAKGEADWVEGTLELAVELAGARDDCGKDNNKFGEWLSGRFGDNVLPKDERAILIRWGCDPRQTRIVLETTDSRSIQVIDRGLRNATKTPTTPPVGGSKSQAAHAALQAAAATGVKVNQRTLAQSLGVSQSTVGEAVRDLKAAQAPTLTYTKAQDYHVDARIRVLDKAREAEFEERVRLRVLADNKAYRETLSQLKDEASRQKGIYEKLNNEFKPIFNETEFMTILTCLHPDNSASVEKRNIAFRAFSAMKFQLTGKK